jgi:hypothetical protein
MPRSLVRPGRRSPARRRSSSGPRASACPSTPAWNAAAPPATPGFAPDDVAWLLANAPGEIVVVRPDHDDDLLDLESEDEPPATRGGTVAVPAAFN